MKSTKDKIGMTLSTVLIQTAILTETLQHNITQITLETFFTTPMMMAELGAVDQLDGETAPVIKTMAGETLEYSNYHRLLILLNI